MNIYSKLLSLTITLLISLAFISDASAQRRYKHVKRVRTPEGISLKPQKTNRSPVNTVPEITLPENKLSIENPEQKMEPEISGTEWTSNPGTAKIAETPIYDSKPKQMKRQTISRKTILSQNASKALFKANTVYFFQQAGTDADQKSNGSKTGLVLTIVGAVLLVIGILLFVLIFNLGALALLLLIFVILLGLVAALIIIAGLVLLIIGAVKLAASKKNSE